MVNKINCLTNYNAKFVLTNKFLLEYGLKLLRYKKTISMPCFVKFLTDSVD